MIGPDASADGLARRSSSASATSRMRSSRSSRFSSCFAETRATWTSPPHSSGCKPSVASSLSTRSGFASGRSMFKLQCQLRRDQNGPWWRHPANWLRWLGEIAVGYGYRWQRVLYATFAVWALFSLFYLEINRKNGFCQVSIETEVCVPRTENPKNYDFNAALYSMQALLVAPKEIVSYVIFPKAKIQPRALNLDHIDKYKPSAGRSVTYFDAVTLSPDAVEYAKLAEIFFGWAAALMLMAVATDMIKRE